MKLSVSIPDPLWMRSCQIAETTSPSEVVQSALNRFVAGREPSALADDDPLRLRVAEIAAARRHEALEHLRIGYEAGLQQAHETLTWELLDLASEKDFDLQRVKQQIVAEYGGDEGFPDLATALDNLDTFAHQHGVVPQGVFMHGVRAALRDVWRAVADSLPA